MELASGWAAAAPSKGTIISCAINLGILINEIFYEVGDELNL